MRRSTTKRRFLQAAGAWNPRVRDVRSERFAQSDFFDPLDKVQVKYEMLRSHVVDNVPVSVASEAFGYSREAFYTTMEKLREQGVAGLADAKRGPKGPRKVSVEVERFIVAEIGQERSLSGQELADRVEKKLGAKLHRRSIERLLLRLKKRLPDRICG
jgi:transposase